MDILRTMSTAVALAMAPVFCASALAQSEVQDQSTNVADRLALAEKIIAISYPEDKREAMFFAATDQTTAQVLKSMEGWITDEGAREIVDAHILEMTEQQKIVLRRHIPRIMTAFAVAYSNLFDESELRDILTFVETPTGSTFLIRSVDILSDPNFAAVNQAHMDETMSVVKDSIPILVTKLTEYKAGQATAED